MSWLTTIWSMIASACLTLAVMHLLVWRKRRTAGANLALGLAAAMCCQIPVGTQAANSTFRSDSEYLIDTWETEDGLPENSATAMVQTPDGYLWFGTWNGLVRFDGVKFTVFDPGNTPQLPNAGIVNLHLDQRGRMWVSTLGGLVVRESGEGQVAGGKWRTFGTNEGWAGNYVRTFAERAGGDLLLTTFDGHVLEFGGDRLKELPHPPSPPKMGFFGAVDETGQWWVTQRDFVGRWDGQRWIQTYFPDRSQSDPGVPSLSARDGGVWILSGKELLKIRQGAEVSRVSLPQLPSANWSLSEDSRTNVWIGSYGAGLFRLDPRGSLQHWTPTNGLGNLNCRFVFEDHEGNLWVGTSRGLSRFKPRRVQDLDRERLLSERLARAVWPASDGGMWVATYDQGLFRYDALGISIVGVPGPESGHLIGLSVLEDHAGRVWYRGNEACWWRRGPADFEKTPLRWAQDANGRALFEDSKGRIWISAWQGVVLYDGNVFHEFGSEVGLPPGGIKCIGEDHAGVPWLAAEEGVFRYEKDRFVEVSTVDSKSLREIISFKADPDGTMWMGTRTRGLLRLRDGRLSAIGPPLGFPVEAVHAIIEDDQGYFWMPSNRGIVRASRRDLHAVADGAEERLDCQLLDWHDGLPSVECSPSQPSCARDRSGRLWFATQRGVAMIDPASFRLNSRPPPVHIEQVDYQLPRAGSKAGNPQPSGDTGAARVRLVAPLPEPLRLPAGSYGLEITYTALNFSSPEKLRFQTKLEGSDRDWEDAEGLRIARYHQLQPGDYVFRVRAANNDGVWNEAGARLAFTVLPFYWQTIWFRVAMGLLLLGGGGGTIAWWAFSKHHRELAELERTRQQQSELAHLSRVTMLGELSGSLAHELNQPLTAILSNAQAAQRFLAHDNADLDEVRDILKDIVDEDKRAGEVIRRLRLLLKKGEVQHQPLDLNEVVLEVLKLVRSDLVNQGVTAQTELAPGLPVLHGDRVQLQQVLLNLVINACDAMSGVATADRQFIVRTKPAYGQGVEASVSDCGDGIPADKLEQVFEPFFTTKAHGMGLGLSVCRTIITAHGGKLWVTNNAARGATFHFTLPAEGEGSNK